MTKTAEKPTIDLADYSAKDACEKGFELELKHPATGDPLGVFITVLGSDSEVFQSHIRKRANARLKKAAGRREEATTIEQVEKDAIALLAACTISWRTGQSPTITHDGKPLDCTAGNAKFLYAERWIREQVDEAVGDLGNFMLV